MNDRKVSVIMGVFNSEKTLVTAIESVLSQTYRNWEFIICDDGSSDGSSQILAEYQQRNSRIRVLRNENNIGLAASLNRCLAFVNGEYIARMDSDDISLPDRFKRQVDYLETHPKSAVVGTYMQAFNDNGFFEIIKNVQTPTRCDLPKGNPFAHATIMIRTEVLRALNGYHVPKYTERTEDVDLWYRLFAAGYGGENICEPLYLVRVDRNAIRRRKLKYMIHASYIIWKGVKMIGLPSYYRVFCLKPILSWVIPENIKTEIRKLRKN